MVIKKPIILLILLFLVNLALFYQLIDNRNKALKHQGFSIRQEYINCLTKSDKPQIKGQCLRALATAALKNSSVSGIVAAMSSINGPTQAKWCHEFLHYVGWEVFNETQKLDKAFTVANAICDSGMYHGIVEQYINASATSYNPDQFVNTIVPNACAELSKQGLPRGIEGPCYHGLGHAFMFITENGLNKALKYCDYLSSVYQESCYTGVFMENLQSKQIGRFVNHPNKFSFNSSDPNYPCNQLDDKYKKQCYSYKGVYFTMQTNDSVKQSMSACLGVTPTHHTDCFWGVGSNIVGPQRSSFDSGKKCNEAIEISSLAYKQCIIGAMSFVVQLNQGKAEESVSLCKAIEDNYKTVCYIEAGKNLRNWIMPNETIEEKCKQFPDYAAQKLCLNPD